MIHIYRYNSHRQKLFRSSIFSMNMFWPRDQTFKNCCSESTDYGHANVIWLQVHFTFLILNSRRNKVNQEPTSITLFPAPKIVFKIHCILSCHKNNHWDDGSLILILGWPPRILSSLDEIKTSFNERLQYYFIKISWESGGYWY